MSGASQISCYTSQLPAVRGSLDEPCWYAIQTRARHEKKVAAQLQEKGVTTFLPLVSQVRRWSDRNQVVQLPLFSGYAFVRMVQSAEAHQLVLRTDGLVRFVGVGGRGVPIPDKEIEDIRTILANKQPCAPHPFLRVGQRVRIRGGCLDGVEGILLAKDSNRSLVLSIELIRRSLAIRVEGYDVEVI